MYYNSNGVNSDYYNAYRREVFERQNQREIKIIKYILLFLILLALLFASFYFYYYFKPTATPQKSPLVQQKLQALKQPLATPIVIKEEELPVSIQALESSTDSMPTKEQNLPSSINKKDIELIVKIIINQMKSNNKKSLEEQLQEANKRVFVKKSLKEVDHYNKVVLPHSLSQQAKEDALVQLNQKMQNLINDVKEDKKSHYTQAIKKEIVYRKNEMRIIVVQKGDTLSKIAKRAYGNYDDYKKIFAANPEIIHNPDQIYVGQRLRIPS
jgi:LysM repeat protein